MWFLTILFLNQIGYTKSPKKSKALVITSIKGLRNSASGKLKMLAKKILMTFFLGSCTAPNFL